MNSAKALHVAPIKSRAANRFVTIHHYSGRALNNSQLHLGVFLDTRLVGAMQFGPPMYRRQILGLIEGTAWDGMWELNRMVFVDNTPRNSESRALGVAFRLIRQQYPRIEWILSYADATQCGDGTVYRACGFILTGIRRNNQTWISPFSEVRARATLTHGVHARRNRGRANMTSYRKAGWVPLDGYQLRYIKFLNRMARERLSVP